jgi:hypothetical protein
MHNTPELARLLIGEILLTEHRHLENIPSGGRGLYLDDDHVLLWSNGQTYRLIQGDWVEVPPESIPVQTYIPHLRRALENRKELINKRLAKLVSSLEAIGAIEKALDPLILGALAKALLGSADLRG